MPRGWKQAHDSMALIALLEGLEALVQFLSWLPAVDKAKPISLIHRAIKVMLGGEAEDLEQ